jgi:hypothetical protein
VPAARGQNAGQLRNRKIVPRRKVEPCDDGRTRRGRKEGRMAGADAPAPLLVRGIVMSMVPRVRLGGGGRDEIRRAGMDGLQRDAPQSGRSGQEEKCEQRELTESRHHAGKLALGLGRW